MSTFPSHPDERVNLWRQLLAEKLAKCRTRKTVGLWFIYAEELKKRTGHMLPDGGYDLIEAALQPFKDDPEFEVYNHTFNRYEDEKPEDRYFVIAAREKPANISWG